MAAATAAGAAATAAAVSLIACYILLHKSRAKLSWFPTVGFSRASGRRVRRRGLVEAIGNTPLIRINSLSDATGCEILGKAEFLNPGGSVKDRVAVKIIEEGIKNCKIMVVVRSCRTGLLVLPYLSIGSGSLLVVIVAGLPKLPLALALLDEGSAGSTAISLATVAPAYGCRCHVVIPDDAAIEKSQIIEALGATVERVRPVSITHRDHFVNIARRRALEANKLAAAQRESSEKQTNGLTHVDSEMLDDKLAVMQRESNKMQNGGPAHVNTEFSHCGKCDVNSDSKGGFFADQFENLANYRAHYECTGPEIWKQTKGNLHAFVAAAGTGGTIAGVSRYLKEKNRSIKCFLMDPPGSGLFNKVTRGVMYTKEEAEGKRLKNPFDTITEGIGINRVTKNFMMAELDGAYRGSDREAVEMSRFLLKNDGLFVGSSSAMNCVGAVRVAQDLGPGHTIVTILCDSGMRHLSKFFNEQYLADHGLTPTATGLEFLDK
ncbi:Pyridoxal-5'-phosphate-dependent enzyme family protein [Zea mays]|uniref:cysteine synthase n=2 Tax=Zea mays TaxID=4577 RepID=A0A1D6JTA1_MAIZE|nr:Pyridoxal-5'-phosphate-dependent enzyme family protein [Zea mays]